MTTTCGGETFNINSKKRWLEKRYIPLHLKRMTTNQWLIDDRNIESEWDNKINSSKSISISFWVCIKVGLKSFDSFSQVYDGICA